MARMRRGDGRLTRASTTFADALRGRGLSYPTAARMVTDSTGVACSAATIGIIARGEREPSYRIGRAISKALRFPLRELITL